MQKTQKEVAIMNAFLVSCKNFKDRCSYEITSPDPPMPDCCCVFSDGSKWYFELSEILDQKIAQKFYDQRIEFSGGFFSDDILTERIEEKVKKTYLTNGIRTDLLLYFDLQPGWSEKTMLEQTNLAIQRLGKGSFNTVWLFDVQKHKVIGVI